MALKISREEIRSVYRQGEDAVIELVESLVAQINALTERVKDLEESVRQLKLALSKDSHNSHKPPGSDGPNRPIRTSSLREKSGRKPGGQEGHEPYMLKLSENPDRIVHHRVKHCKKCGVSLTDVADSRVDRRQDVDLPPLRFVVTEHQAHVTICPCCGVENGGEFPAGLNHEVEYGPGIKALANYLMHGNFIPYDRLSEFFKDVFNQGISPGSLFNFGRNCFRLLEDSVNRIKEDITQSPVAHFDETGMRMQGKCHWLHSASTKESTYYEIHDNHGHKAMDAIGILPEFGGIAVHDHLKAYFEYSCGHGLCNAHHLRELTFLNEGYDEAWAGKMKKCLKAMKASADFYRGKRKTLPRKLLQYYENRFDRIVREGFRLHENDPKPFSFGKGGHKRQTPGKNMLDRLRKDKTAVLAFLHNLDVPFDNNQAERDLRMAKLKQKISGCFRSFEGAKIFCRIRSFIATLRKRNLPVLDSLRATFANAPPILVSQQR